MPFNPNEALKKVIYSDSPLNNYWLSSIGRKKGYCSWRKSAGKYSHPQSYWREHTQAEVGHYNCGRMYQVFKKTNENWLEEFIQPFDCCRRRKGIPYTNNSKKGKSKHLIMYVLDRTSDIMGQYI